VAAFHQGATVVRSVLIGGSLVVSTGSDSVVSLIVDAVVIGTFFVFVVNHCHCHQSNGPAGGYQGVAGATVVLLIERVVLEMVLETDRARLDEMKIHGFFVSKKRRRVVVVLVLVIELKVVCTSVGISSVVVGACVVIRSKQAHKIDTGMLIIKALAH
jgi:hypothetical protein